MSKTKYIIIALFVSCMLLLIPSLVNAETFQTEDGITATKIVESTDGTVDFKFTNITLSDEGNYTWGVSKTSSAEEVEKWFTLTDFNSTNKSAVLSLTPSVTSIYNVLRTTNTAWLYIKDAQNNTYIVNGLKVDLTLPISKAFSYSTYQNDNYSPKYFSIKRIYGISRIYYKFEKITDEKIIEEYQTAKTNGTDIYYLSGLATLSQAPETGWEIVESTVSERRINLSSNAPKEDGLYYLWIKAKDEDTKSIIDYTLYQKDANAPTVTSIEVVSPTSGTYKTSQTVKIRVNFNEVITGTSVPTLKIKFGNSAERSVTNGTIKSNYIEYSYNIQDSDVGQLATSNLEGGTITDASGNKAKLSCPIISGYTIKANIEGTTTNNTDNQDKTNNNSTNPPSSTNNGNTNNNSNTNNGSSTQNPSTQKDNTTASGKIPQTGVGVGLSISLLVIIGVSAICYLRYRRYRDI